MVVDHAVGQRRPAGRVSDLVRSAPQTDRITDPRRPTGVANSLVALRRDAAAHYNTCHSFSLLRRESERQAATTIFSGALLRSPRHRPPSLYCLSERATRRRSPSSERPPSLPRPPLRRGLLSSPPSLSAGRWFLRPRMVGAFARPPSPHPHPFPPPSLSLPCPLPPSRTSALYTEKRARRGTFLSIYFHLLFICPSLFLFSLSMPLRVLQRGNAGC